MYFNPTIVEHAHVVLGVDTYMPEGSWRDLRSYVGSKLVTGSPACPNKQEEHIPLASPQPVPRIGLALSVHEAKRTDQRCDAGHLDPLVFNFHLENRIHVKHLDYPAFAQWGSVMALLEDLECDGTVIEQLWDVREEMAICSGDWDARVRPGLEVDVVCGQSDPWQGDLRRSRSNWDEDEETVKALERGDNPLLRKHWWFERWRRKVEQEAFIGNNAGQEPSWQMLLVGSLSMAMFLGVMLVFCTI